MAQTISAALHRFGCGATSRAKTIKSNSDDKRLGVAALFRASREYSDGQKSIRWKRFVNRKKKITKSLKKYV